MGMREDLEAEGSPLAAAHERADGPEYAAATFEAVAPTDTRVERVWREYWLPLLRDPVTGRLNVAQLKGELYDAWHLVNEARAVYRHVTGGLCDDLTASAEGIIASAEHAVRLRVERAVERELARVAARTDRTHGGGEAGAGGVSKRDGGTIHRGVAEGAGDPGRNVESSEARDTREVGGVEVGSHGGEAAVEAWRERVRRRREERGRGAGASEAFDTRSTIRAGSREMRVDTEHSPRHQVDDVESADESSVGAVRPRRADPGGAHLDEAEGATREGVVSPYYDRSAYGDTRSIDDILREEAEGAPGSGPTTHFRPVDVAGLDPGPFRRAPVESSEAAESKSGPVLEVLRPDGSHVGFVEAGAALEGLEPDAQYRVRPVPGRLPAPTARVESEIAGEFRHATLDETGNPPQVEETGNPPDSVPRET